MIFLNAALLVGTLAAAIPIIIHLLNRGRSQVVHWGAMQFLQSKQSDRNRRLRWQQLLLLALRFSIPLLLAVAMARPAVDWWRGANATMIKRTYWVEDKSPSMNAKFRLGAIDNLSSVRLGYEQVLSGAQMISTLDATASLEDCFDAIAMEVDSLPDEKLQFFVLTDFQQTEIDRMESQNRIAFRDRIRSYDYPPEIILLPKEAVITSLSEKNNVAVGFDRAGDDLVGTNQSGKIRCVVNNFGSKSYRALKYEITVDGENQTTGELNLDPMEEQSFWVNLPPLRPGDHLCRILIAAEDDLELDNTAVWVVRCVEPEPILLIHGRPKDKGAKGLNLDGTPFLQLALRPPSIDNPSNTTSVSNLPRLFNPSEPIESLDQKKIVNALQQNSKHVVLCNVDRLDNNVLDKILESTRDGSLTIFLGPDIALDWYEKNLFPKLGDVWDSIQIRDTKQQVFTNSEVRTTASSKQPWANALNSAVEQGPAWNVFSAWRLSVLQSDSINVIAQLADNLPLIICSEDSRRKVILMSCDVHPTQSNFALLPSFVPAIQDIFRGLIFSNQVQRNLPAGEPLPQLATPINTKSPTKWDVVLPETQFFQNELKELGSAEQRASVNAVYKAVEQAAENQTVERLLATQMSRLESNLAVASEANTQSFCEDVGAKILNAESELNTLKGYEESNNQRSEVWRIVLTVLLFAMFSELLLQRWMR